jgi:hypothetical protein
VKQEQVIFLVSQPRAGSTLLQTMLNGHTRIDSAPEPWLMFNPLYVLKEQHGTTDFGHKSWGASVDDFLCRIPDGHAVYDQHMRDLALDLYGKARSNEDHLFLDKTPRYFLILDDLMRIMPEARYIMLIRNPLAVLMSTLATFPYPERVCIRHGSDLLDGPRCLVEGLAKYRDRMTVVQYEQLVLDPDTHLQTICNDFGLDYQTGMTEYSKHRIPQGKGGDPNIHKHDRPHTASVDKWLKSITSKERADLCLSYMKQLGKPTFEALGYDYDHMHQQILDSSGTLKSEYTFADRMRRVRSGVSDILGKAFRGHRRYHTAWS